MIYIFNAKLQKKFYTKVKKTHFKFLLHIVLAKNIFSRLYIAGKLVILHR